MQPLRLAACLLPALFGSAACARDAQQPVRGQPWIPEPKVARLGINLSGPADWNTEVPFVDAFRMSRPWISQREGAPWGSGPALQLDENGWVKRLEPGCFAETLLCTIEGGHYPSGRYTVLYDGDGELRFGGSGKLASSQPGRLHVDVDSSKGALFLQLRRTNPSNPVRNIRVILPGFESTYRQNPFHPAFLERWRGVAVVRMMDWMHTNNSKIVRWEDRPKPESATFSEKGVAPELLVDLCNRLNADLWVCIPHKADDGYVRGLAALIRERLRPPLRVYVEYSNEVWNAQFEQARYAAEQGRRLKLGGEGLKDWDYQWHHTAHRSLQIFDLFEKAMGDRRRLVRVLAAQAANDYVAQRILSFNDAGRKCDALAIAPYFGLTPRPDGDPSADTVVGWGLDGLFRHLQDKVIPETAEWIRKHKRLADQYGIALIAYEGGQHLVGIQGAENNERLTALFHAAQSDPRMGECYRRYLDGWRENGGGVFCHFSSVAANSKWGSWGLLQHMDEDPKASPKMQAVLAWARSLGQKVGP
ncbi:MAG: hypothetical protein WHU10_03520 [Fimbriimonadales bacterium]